MYCDIQSFDDYPYLCRLESKPSDKVKVQIMKEDLIIFDDVLPITFERLMVAKITGDEPFLGKITAIKVSFMKDISCLKSEDFNFVLKASTGSYKISNPEEIKIITPHLIQVKLPEVDLPIERMSLETYFSSNGETNKVDERGFSLSVNFY